MDRGHARNEGQVQSAPGAFGSALAITKAWWSSCIRNTCTRSIRRKLIRIEGLTCNQWISETRIIDVQGIAPNHAKS